MTTRRFIAASLRYYWRTHLAAGGGIAVAVAVLAGSFVVGESVRATLRRMALERIGPTDQVLTGDSLFREALAAQAGVPMLALEGTVWTDSSEKRATRVMVYGVDERFFTFLGSGGKAPENRSFLLSRSLADELGVKAGDGVAVRVDRPSAIPSESLHGRKDDPGRTMRGEVQGFAGDFSLRQQQGPVRAVYASLRRMQRDLEQPGKVNVALAGGDVTGKVRDQWQLADLGIKVRDLGERGVNIETEAMVLSDALAEQVGAIGGTQRRLLTYLANTIKANGREIPYSLIAADSSVAGLTLNTWAARELNAKPGDTVRFDYYEWLPSGRLMTRAAQYPVAAIVPLKDERELAPEYPGISDSKSVVDWDPPFPMDLGRIRKIDEDYWDAYRTTPKMFLPIAEGQKLWGSRWGKLTGIRVTGMSATAVAERLRARVDPLASGLTLRNVRAEAMEAARGSTDFGEYFTYFSFFLVVSALLLAGLFFRLSIEQRASEVGLLRAVGLPPGVIRRLLLGEGMVVALGGSTCGLALAAAWGAFVVYGLRTWWVDAVGTRDISLTVTPQSLLLGFAGGMLIAPVVLLLSLRRLSALTPRALAAGSRQTGRGLITKATAVLGIAGAAALVVGAALDAVPAAAGYFGGGALLLAGGLAVLRLQLARGTNTIRSVPSLGLRYAGYRPGRSVLAAALIASATFLIVSVDSFRKPPVASSGYEWIAESSIPLFHDLNSKEGREALLLPDEAAAAKFIAFRLRPGDDASCLNLYAPREPRILGAPQGFGDEQLRQTQPDGAIPAIADFNSLTYVLHKKVGDTMEVAGKKLRFVGALHDSVFQSEVMVAEEQFLKAWPEEQGYRVFLIDGPAQVVSALEKPLADFGFDVTSVSERIAAYHRVENAYLRTFQALGGLGLLLGTAGLAAVLLRNVIERRRELALLRATGFDSTALQRMVLAENLLLLGCGLGIGMAAAMVAVAPAWISRGGSAPILSLALLLGAVFATGVAASYAATRMVVRSPLLESLRAD